MDFAMLLQVTIPLAGLIGWAWLRLDKRFDKIDDRFNRIEKTLSDHGERISLIEGFILGRDHRKTGTGK